MSESSGLKNLIIIGGGIIGLVLIILLVVWIISLAKPHYIKYEALETKMVEASKKYYATNPKLLPGEGEEAILNYDSLVRENYIKPLNELLKDGDKCSAHVIINNIDANYEYTPYLNCPENYETKELYKIILKNNDVVTSGSGLYADNKGNYYFRGDVTNNYLKLGTLTDNSHKDDNIWVIMSIESDNTIKIRKYRHVQESYVWDDRYNVLKEANYGYNDFNVSRIKDTLKTILDTSESLDKKIISKLTPKKLCIGIRKENDKSKDGSAECSTMSEESFYLGVMAPYEYMRASLDENCTSLTSQSCGNYNYLTTTSSEWSLIASDADNYKVYVFGSTYYRLSSANNQRSLYPTAYLNKRAFYVSGTGTFSDPYTIK